MINRTRPLLAVLLLTSFATLAYRYASAGEDQAEVQATPAAGAHLVVMDLGTDGVEQTVILDPVVARLGTHEFLRGEVSNAYKEFRGLYPGNVASIRMDRVVYIQSLPVKNPDNGG